MSRRGHLSTISNYVLAVPSSPEYPASRPMVVVRRTQEEHTIYVRQLPYMHKTQEGGYQYTTQQCGCWWWALPRYKLLA